MPITLGMLLFIEHSTVCKGITDGLDCQLMCAMCKAVSYVNKTSPHNSICAQHMCNEVTTDPQVITS